jgi:hypothetical protein
MAEVIGAVILQAVGVAATEAIVIGTLTISAATLIGTTEISGPSVSLRDLLLWGGRRA